MKEDKRRKPEKARQICEMYHDGLTMTAIAKVMDCHTNSIVQYLDRYYSKFYGEAWKRKRIQYNDEELYSKFIKVYSPEIYTRRDLCEKIGCSIFEFEHMCETYNISFLKCLTYKHQKTLCNVPKEVYDDVKKYANSHNMSIRKLTMLAINEYILREGLEK